MKLGTRLWLYGALLPSAVTLAALLLAGQAFRAALESSLDRALLAQGAAESVSLFDREDGPHLHMAESPLLEEVQPFAPTGELFDEAGRLVAHFPPAPHPEPLPPPPVEGPASELLTVEAGGARERVLLARVRSGEHRYVLRLTASLALVDESVRTFHLVALTFVVGAGALLLVVQSLLGRRLSRRIGALKAHVQLLERGELDAQPEADAAGDEVAALREVLATATAQLKRAREVQDRLLADAAHELRTPLTLMRTSLDLALRRERTPEELREALEDARAEVDRLARLATALLDMAAAGRGWDTAPADLAALVDDATEAARAEAEQRGTWFEVDAPRPASARVNATALRQAVDNLVSNALRFAPKGTPIRVTLERRADAWRLAVRDEGPGIPEAQREAVFAPFHRVDRGGGSGLGLAIVSEVLRQHGGRAWAEAPEAGPGIVVVLEVPAGGGRGRQTPHTQV